MSHPGTAQQTLDREFLEIRAKILEVAAALDRLDRAEGSLDGDRRMSLLRRGMEALRAAEPDRAEQVQLIFSLDYDEAWREKAKLQSDR